MSDEAFTLNTKNLDGLLKALKTNMSKARVGILGQKTVRGQVEVKGGKSVNATSGVTPKGKIDVTTNAAVGALHEFGTDKMPQRSFLRVPLSDHLQKELEGSGAFSPDELKKVVKEASMLPWLTRISIIAEKIVQGAFDSGGYGKWPAWEKGYTNNSGQILVDTQQLRNSITSEVK
jgi:phage gpG-like protein